MNVILWHCTEWDYFRSMYCLNSHRVITDFHFFSDLLRNIRTQVLIKLIKPYTRIHIPFISKELNIDTADVEALLVQCILDK